MSEGTKIDWADATINPLGWGCYGPGGTEEEPKRCPWCYAHRMAKRNLRECPECRAFVPHWHEEEMQKPLRWSKGRRIFVQSMGDLFGAGVSRPAVIMVESLAWDTPRHTYIALTKSPERMAAQLQGITLPPNLWLGTSITNQADADERIPHLLNTPAAVRWLSIEPLLGRVDLNAVPWRHGAMAAKGWSGVIENPQEPDDYVWFMQKHALQWVVIGAQTGPGAVAPKPDWIGEIIDQCTFAGIPVFVKDNVGWPVPFREFPAVRA